MDAAEAFRILLEVTRAFQREPQLEAALRSVTDAALKLLDCNRASVGLLDDARARILTGARSSDQVDDRAVAAEVIPHRGVPAWVIEHGEIVRVSDSRDDPRLRDQLGDERAVLGVPLWSGGTVIGLLVASSEQPSAFDESSEELATLLVHSALPFIARRRYERLAVTDHQTLAFKSQYLIPRITEEMDRSQRFDTDFSILTMGLDDLEGVRRKFGPHARHAVLRDFADRIRSLVRKNDVLVRCGDDEFVLLMPSTGAKQALPVAVRVRTSLLRGGLRAGVDRVVTQTASMGIAGWDGDESAEALELRAKRSMAKARQRGGNRLVVASSPDP